MHRSHLQIPCAEFCDPNALPLRLVVLPARGGAPLLIRDWPSEPSWPNNSRRTALRDWITGAMGSVGMNGGERPGPTR